MTWRNFDFPPSPMEFCVANDCVLPEVPAKPSLRGTFALMKKGIQRGRQALRELGSASAPVTNLERALHDFGRELTPEEVARLRIAVMGRAKELEPARQAEIFMMMRDALIHALRHAEARMVEAEIEYLSKRLRVVVRDDGVGADTEQLRKGKDPQRRLLGIRERGESIGARVRIWTRAGAGTEVEISLAI